MITPSEIVEAIDDYDYVLDQHLAGEASEDDVEEAKANVMDLIRERYFDPDGKIDKTHVAMDKPNGPIVDVKGAQLFVTLRDQDNPEDLTSYQVVPRL